MKVFISQPMRDKTDKQILDERILVINKIKEKYNDAEIINSILDRDKLIERKEFENVKNPRVYYLGESIKLLSQADALYLCEGWENTNGCKVEKFIADNYEISILEL